MNTEALWWWCGAAWVLQWQSEQSTCSMIGWEFVCDCRPAMWQLLTVWRLLSLYRIMAAATVASPAVEPVKPHHDVKLFKPLELR
ncbi:hypothetical protein M0R45_030074 [Rubus argutus]|uniref:Secreted protein n=1 Tax=Rubus argutus TaxID=59490 RepID=A0AAW1WDK6_RUBAR